MRGEGTRLRSRQISIWLCAFAILCSCTSAFSAIFILNNTDDTFAVNLTTGQDAFGNITLRSALQAANATAGPDTIEIFPGTFTLTRSGAGEDFAETGDLDITDDVTILGNGAVIDAAQLDQVFEVISGNFAISNVTIMGGTADNGGALVVTSGTVNIGNSSLIQNQADNGGAIAASGGAVSILNSTISENTANTLGGGIYATDSAAVLLSFVTIAANTAASEGGGVKQETAAVTSDNTIIATNSGTTGNDFQGTVTSLGNNLMGFWNEGPDKKSDWVQYQIDLRRPDSYAAFQSDAAVYHDDVEDYVTNEPTIFANGLGIALLSWYRPQ